LPSCGQFDSLLAVKATADASAHQTALPEILAARDRGETLIELA
jgi:hypothetical protein